MLFRLAIVIAAIGLLSSCGISSNLTSNLNLNQTNVILSQNNYHVVGTVEASVSSSYFLGIGGLSKKALHNNAVAELTKKANLSGAQALINVTVKSSGKFLFVFGSTTLYAEATIIEFDN